MARTVVKDYVVWAKHVDDDPHLVNRILKMRPSQTIALVVDGIPGVWEKMADDPSGRSTPGLKPVGPMKQVWSSFYRERRGNVVEIGLPESEARSAGGARIGLEPPLARSEAEREGAWRGFLSLAGKGWRSEGPYGPRDELYER